MAEIRTLVLSAVTGMKAFCPQARKFSIPTLTIAVALGTVSCSMLPAGFDGAAGDNIKYRSSDASIKSLAIPPGLSAPEFDESYAVNDAPVSTDAGGTTVSSAQETVAQRSSPGVQMAALKTGEPMLAVDAPLEQSWPWVGSMLQRTGLKVVKQQPTEGIYTVEYQGAPGEKQSWTDKLNSMISGVTFGDSDPNRLKLGETYLVVMSGNSVQQSFVVVADKNGKPAQEAIANQILNRLKAEFER